jgi:hypothetical protein
LLVADLFWEKSTVGWWLISQENMPKSSVWVGNGTFILYLKI